MIHRRILLPCALVLAANVAALLAVRSNRAGGSLRTMELTSRELYARATTEDNSGIMLRIQYESDSDGTTATWLTPKKLAELGLRAKPGPGLSPARKVYVALELDGEARQQWLRLMQTGIGGPHNTQEREWNEREQRTHTRLFAVNAARDAGTLLRKYPDGRRYLIAAATIRVWADQHGVVQGRVDELLIPEIHVPLEYSGTLQHLIAEKPAHDNPAYRVRLCQGSNLEPWVCGVDPAPVVY